MKKIFILAGVYSKEREISLKTAKSVHKELIKNTNYNIKIQELNRVILIIMEYKFSFL